MKYQFNKCSSVNRNKILTIKERKSKITFHNKNKIKILKVKVDNCLSFQGKKCDWLVIVTSQDKCFFIELKGSDVRTAFKQLGNSIVKIERKYVSGHLSKKHCIVVFNNYAPLSSIDLKKQRRIFFSKYGINPKVYKSKNACFKVS